MRSELRFLPLVILFLTVTPLLSVDVNISLVYGTFAINNQQYVTAGFPNLPSGFVSTNTDAYLFYTLALGAQFVAAQAVSEGLFNSSDCNVTKVYNSSVSNPVESPVVDTQDINLAGHHYYFDVQLQSSTNEIIRAQMVVLINEYTYSFQVSWYKFNYVVSYQGQLTEMGLGFANDTYEYNIVNKNYKAGGTSLTEPDVPVVVQLPQLGVSLNYDANLPASNWAEVDINSRVNNDDFQYLMIYGVTYAINQVYNTGNYRIDNSTMFSISSIYSVWERNSTSQTDFKFDIAAFSNLSNQTVRCNFQMWYNPSQSALNFYAWGVESIIDPTLDY